MHSFLLGKKSTRCLFLDSLSLAKSEVWPQRQINETRSYAVQCKLLKLAWYAIAGRYVNRGHTVLRKRGQKRIKLNIDDLMNADDESASTPISYRRANPEGMGSKVSPGTPYYSATRKERPRNRSSRLSSKCMPQKPVYIVCCLFVIEFRNKNRYLE